MFYDDLFKMSMTNWLIVFLGLEPDSQDPATEEERFYQRY